MSLSEGQHTPDKTSVHYDPFPGDPMRPPWYRPPIVVVKGPRRLRTAMSAGYVIPYKDGYRWFDDSYKIKLAEDHRQDLNIPLRLSRVLTEKRIGTGDCLFAERRLSPWSDFLVVTQRLSGLWIHDGPENCEEVLEEEKKPIPGPHDEEVKEKLLEMGLHPGEFKCYYK
ncbi:hypothetical protein B0H10DRAFT_2231956 [Mycena sp. CBHHK59/15]|nr:hypothetical protein B0H10DRAFT_2231956 [Mycena sp. CBHHK59/15]